MKRVLLILFVVLVMVLLVIAAAFQYEPVQKKVIQFVVEQIETHSGMVLEVTNPVVAFPLRFKADHFHLHFPDQKGLEIDSLNMRISVLNLLRNRLVITFDYKTSDDSLNPTRIVLRLSEREGLLTVGVTLKETNGKMSRIAQLPLGYHYKLSADLSGTRDAWKQFINKEMSENFLIGEFQAEYSASDDRINHPFLGSMGTLKGDLTLKTNHSFSIQNVTGNVSDLILTGHASLNSDYIFENSLMLLNAHQMAYQDSIVRNVKGTVLIQESLFSPTFKVELQASTFVLQNFKIRDISILSNLNFNSKGAQGNVSAQLRYQDAIISGNAMFDWDNNTLYLTDFSGLHGFGQGLGNLAISKEETGIRIMSQGRIETLLEQFSTTSSLPLTGDATISLLVNNAKESPEISGKISIQNGNMELIPIGTAIKELMVLADIVGNKITIQKISGFDNNRGAISGSGQMDLDVAKNVPLSLDLKLEKFSFSPFYYTTTMASGDLHFNANLDGGSLSGAIVTESIDIIFPNEREEHPYAYPVTYINHPEKSRFPTSVKAKTFVWPVTLDIDVEVPSKGHIDGAQWNSEWEGVFTVMGTLDAILLQGICTIRKGEYRFNGYAFQIDEGTITFAGDPYNKTTLYVIASRDLDEIKAEIILKGPLKNPAISFRSNPPLPQREILSWILFGTGSSEITPFQGTQLNASITNLGYGSKPDMLTRIRNKIGIDRIDISRDDNGGANIQVGKYISRGIFVSVNKSVTSETNRLALEAKVMKNVKVQAEVGDDSEAELMLKWKHDY